MTFSSIDYADGFGELEVAPDHNVCRRVNKVRHKQTTKEAFKIYHEANPFVYDLLVKFARQVKAAGVHNYGIRALCEQVRWHVRFGDFEWKPGAEWKLNNNHSAHYSRLIMEQESDLHGFFQLRYLRGNL